MYPSPEQIEGARFLAARRAALLGDEPGFGKTAQAVMAADLIGARRILVITTASARAHWLAEFRAWSLERRRGWAIFGQGDLGNAIVSDVVVTSWALLRNEEIYAYFIAASWDLLILDESHFAANIVGQNGAVVDRTLRALGKGGLTTRAKRTWCLTGTPYPSTPDDIWPTLLSLAPYLLRANPERGWPAVIEYGAFVDRYCEVELIAGQGRIPARRRHVGSRNLDELRERMAPFMLRRMNDALPPMRASVYTVHADKLPDRLDDEQEAAILDAARLGATDQLAEMMGPLRRITGRLKVEPVIELLNEERNDKIVVFYWHKEVGDALEVGLHTLGTVRLDGSVPGHRRGDLIKQFQRGPVPIFLAQIQAAGEGITLTAAHKALFVEASWVPAHMHQAVRRIYRTGQTRPCQVRVAALSGSIDEALMRIVSEKTNDIRFLTNTTES